VQRIVGAKAKTEEKTKAAGEEEEEEEEETCNTEKMAGWGGRPARIVGLWVALAASLPRWVLPASRGFITRRI
jgi:hypothetical protein